MRSIKSEQAVYLQALKSTTEITFIKLISAYITLLFCSLLFVFHDCKIYIEKAIFSLQLGVVNSIDKSSLTCYLICEHAEKLSAAIALCKLNKM